MVEDAIGLVILFLVALLLAALAGISIIFSFELLASAASWFGLAPVVGWSAVGALGGALIGIWQGLRVRGKSDDMRKLYVGAGLAAAVLLAAGITSPAGRSMLGW